MTPVNSRSIPMGMCTGATDLPYSSRSWSTLRWKTAFSFSSAVALLPTISERKPPSQKSPGVPPEGREPAVGSALQLGDRRLRGPHRPADRGLGQSQLARDLAALGEKLQAQEERAEEIRNCRLRAEELLARVAEWREADSRPRE